MAVQFATRPAFTLISNMRFAKHSIAQAEMDMTPMIDVTFQLIAFFMFVLNFSEVDQDQRINLPLSELARPPEVAYDEPLTIQLTSNETIIFAGDELTRDGLKVGPVARGADHQSASREKGPTM